jgi:AraC family transcriptional regulator
MLPHTQHVHCHGMSVAYLDFFAASLEPPCLDEVRILVPGGVANTVEATIRAPGGKTHEAVVRFPEVQVVPPKEACELKAGAPADVTVICLDLAFCEHEGRTAFGFSTAVVGRHTAADPYLRRLGDMLRVGFRLGRPPSAQFLDTISRDVARHVVARYAGEARPRACRGLSPNRLKKVLALIEQRLAEPLQVADLAREVHMSPFHFARMFKHTTGQPPHVYLTAARMDRARELLAETRLPLAEVALRTGFQTQAHFTGVFHEKVGMTPRQYRLRHGKREQ